MAIKFTTELDSSTIREIAVHLQPFIIYGDYAIASIMHQVQTQEIIALEVSKNKKMPDITSVIEDVFDENKEIDYTLYQWTEESWKESDLYDLDVDRTPRWIYITIGLSFIAYILIGFVEIFAIYDWYTIKYEMGAFTATMGATLTAFVPILGSLFAYWSATELWEWDRLNAFLFYFFYYLPLLIGLIYLIFFILKIVWYSYKYR